MLLKKLENYYRNNGILSTEFDCEHSGKCRRGMRLTPENAQKHEDVLDTFTTAKSAFVGEHYGKTVPRLLFVSSDPGSAISKNSPANYSYSSAKSRLPEGVRRINMERMERIKCKPETPKIRLKETNNLAFYILRAFNSEITEGNVMKYYAHTNAAKCCINKDGRGQADKILFDNCQKYLRGEIKLFAPDILVSHGEKAKRGLDYALRGENIADNFYIHNLQNELSFCWFHTPHPSRGGRVEFLKQKTEWDGYVKLIKDFINAGK